MTHVNNIPHILKYGITHKNSPNINPNYLNIGDVSLIDTRNAKRVRVDNGYLFSTNAVTIVLGDFIPFYFGVKMPMLYVMQNGGNFVEKATSSEEIIYLACPISYFIQSDSIFYFTDGHATDNLTTFYDKSKISELPILIDWSSIKSSFWGGHENLNIKRKKQAEFLTVDGLPPKYLAGFGCYNESAKKNLILMGVEENIIKIIPQAYF